MYIEQILHHYLSISRTLFKLCVFVMIKTWMIFTIWTSKNVFHPVTQFLHHSYKKKNYYYSIVTEMMIDVDDDYQNVYVKFRFVSLLILSFLLLYYYFIWFIVVIYFKIHLTLDSSNYPGLSYNIFFYFMNWISILGILVKTYGFTI